MIDSVCVCVSVVESQVTTEPNYILSYKMMQNE